MMNKMKRFVSWFFIKTIALIFDLCVCVLLLIFFIFIAPLYCCVWLYKLYKKAKDNLDE